MIKEKCFKLELDILYYGSNDDERLEKIYELLEILWHLISDDILLSLVESIERRVKVVIKVEGWYTKY